MAVSQALMAVLAEDSAVSAAVLRAGSTDKRVRMESGAVMGSPAAARESTAPRARASGGIARSSFQRRSRHSATLVVPAVLGAESEEWEGLEAVLAGDSVDS